MLTSAFGASIAASIATAYGCAATSSGRISAGVWQLRTKSRVTVKTKSGLVRYILVRYFSTVSIVMSGRRLTNSGPGPGASVGPSGSDVLAGGARKVAASGSSALSRAELNVVASGSTAFSRVKTNVVAS